MDVSNLRRGELIAAIGGLLLAIGVFLPAYSPNSDNPFARIAGGRADASIWDAQQTIAILLLLGAIAPIVLVYIILRGHELSWPRGELTAVIGLVASTLLFYTGVLDRPGTPSGQIGLTFGWFVAFLGALAITVGGASRAATFERRRKPPGVL